MSRIGQGRTPRKSQTHTKRKATPPVLSEEEKKVREYEAIQEDIRAIMTKHEAPHTHEPAATSECSAEVRPMAYLSHHIEENLHSFSNVDAPRAQRLALKQANEKELEHLTEVLNQLRNRKEMSAAEPERTAPESQLDSKQQTDATTDKDGTERTETSRPAPPSQTSPHPPEAHSRIHVHAESLRQQALHRHDLSTTLRSPAMKGLVPVVRTSVVRQLSSQVRSAFNLQPMDVKFGAASQARGGVKQLILDDPVPHWHGPQSARERMSGFQTELLGPKQSKLRSMPSSPDTTHQSPRRKVLGTTTDRIPAGSDKFQTGPPGSSKASFAASSDEDFFFASRTHDSLLPALRRPPSRDSHGRVLARIPDPPSTTTLRGTTAVRSEALLSEAIMSLVDARSHVLHVLPPAPPARMPGTTPRMRR